MKKTLGISILISVLLIVAALFTSCGPKLLGLVPVYVGDPVMDTNHEFEKSDFYVLLNYDDGTDKETTDFEFEVQGMGQGYYIVLVKYKDVQNICYVDIQIDFFED